MIPEWIFIGCMILILFCYHAVMLTALHGLLRNRVKAVNISPGKRIFVSVVVPARNEQQHIESCLNSIVNQKYPADKFEILFSDDFSTDNTRELARECFLSAPGVRCRIIEAVAGDAFGAGKKAAIRRAVEQAEGDLIISTDADTVRSDGWIPAICSWYEEQKPVMILGPVLFQDGGTPLQQMQAVEFAGIMGITGGLAASGIPVMCNGANLAFEKHLMVEGKNAGRENRFLSGDDQFLMMRAKRQSGGSAVQFLFHREAVVSTQPEPTLKRFVSQRIRWASKIRGYRDAAVLAVGGILYFQQVMIFAGFILGIFQPLFIFVSVAAWLMKILADLPVVLVMLKFFQKNGLLKWFLPAQVLQMLYIPFTGMLAPFAGFSWKGRRSGGLF